MKKNELSFLIALLQEAVFIEGAEIVTECRDPRDDQFLELAVNDGAEFIVSGDGDLLSLYPFRGIAIVTPRDFLETA